MELCREEITLTGDVLLGVHSNVAGDVYGYTDGHAWITAETKDNIFYFGLWPDGHPRVADKREECSDVRIGMEMGGGSKVSRYYALTAGQVLRLNAILNRPQGWAYTNTCAAWVVQVMNKVLGMNISAIDYAFFSTPRELGFQLQRLEKNSPTTRMAPRQGAFPEQVRSSSF